MYGLQGCFGRGDLWMLIAGLTLSYFFSKNDSNVHTYVYKRYKNLKKLSYENTGSQN